MKPFPSRSIGDPSILTPLPSALKPLPEDGDVLIRRADVPLYLPIKEQTLARWAVEGVGPRFCKIGKRIVAYRVGDLRTWLQQQTRSNDTQQ